MEPFLQRREDAERVVPDPLAPGARDLRGGHRQRLHRPAHLRGADWQGRQAVDAPPHRGGGGHGVRLPLPGPVELRGLARRSRPRRRPQRRVVNNVPGERPQGGGRSSLARFGDRSMPKLLVCLAGTEQ
jgi:hypothetical protein